MVYGLLGISWTMANSVREEIWIWKEVSGGKKLLCAKAHEDAKKVALSHSS